MFSQVGPQAVRHKSGYLIQIHDRESIDYFNGSVAYRFPMEIGRVYGIYGSPVLDLSAGKIVELDRGVLETIKEQMTEGCHFLGMKIEWCDDQPDPPILIQRRQD